MKKLLPFAIAALIASPALALDEIYSPVIVHHELSLEYNGSRTFDNDASKNNAEDQEIDLEAGLTDYWLLALNGGFEKAPGGSLKLVNAAVENRFEFTEPGTAWMESGMLVAYGFHTQSGAADEIETKLLLQKDIDKWTHTANIGLTQEIGHNSGGGPDYVFLWNSRYRIDRHFQPGIEFQGDLGDHHDLSRFQRQEDYLGPALYGEIVPHVKYQSALLAGVTSTSAQLAGRVLIEYESTF